MEGYKVFNPDWTCRGWKEGNKYRKQWERGAVRKFKKEAEETQQFSGSVN